MMSKVVVLGSINNDIVVFAERHPTIGETVRGDDLRTFPGGKGANQAVAAARAGAHTSMFGLIGEDAPGVQLRDFLASAGVDTTGVGVAPETPTGTALITVAQGDNTIVIVAGANAAVSAEVVERVELAAGDVVLAQFETPSQSTELLFESARAVGATTVLNPAPVTDISKKLLSLVDYLIVNETEFALTFGFDPTGTVPPSAETFRAFPGVIVATIGAEGALVWARGNREQASRIPGVAVVATDSTGAGDCFCGYFAAGLAQGVGLDDALAVANRAAAISVTRPGAASSIPARHEVSQ